MEFRAIKAQVLERSLILEPVSLKGRVMQAVWRRGEKAPEGVELTLKLSEFVVCVDYVSVPPVWHGSNCRRDWGGVLLRLCFGRNTSQ